MIILLINFSVQFSKNTLYRYLHKLNATNNLLQSFKYTLLPEYMVGQFCTLQRLSQGALTRDILRDLGEPTCAASNAPEDTYALPKLNDEGIPPSNSPDLIRVSARKSEV